MSCLLRCFLPPQEAEIKGKHSADEINVACRLMEEEIGAAFVRVNPLQWMEQNWPRRIQLVVARARAIGPFFAEVSRSEAEQALRDTPESIETAAQHVVRERQQKVMYLPTGSEFGKDLAFPSCCALACYWSVLPRSLTCHRDQTGC